MPTDRAKRVMLLGVDCMSSELTRLFVEQGRLPNIAKLMTRGVFFENALPCYPTLTPSNWTTIVTGAWPGTHGITDFTVHHPGEPLDVTHPGFTTEECSAEYLWNAAARAGKRSVLMKYTASWPPVLENGVQVDGCVPGCEHTLCPDHLFVCAKAEGGSPTAEQIERKSDAWTQQKKSEIYKKGIEHVALEAEGGALVGEIVLRPFSGKPCRLGLVAESGGAVRVVDGEKTLASARLGEWSGWFEVRFGDGPAFEGRTRFKVLEVAADGSRLKVYTTSIMPKTGYTQPEGVAVELAENVAGAFIQAPAVGAAEAGWIDPTTFCEVAEFQAEWYAAASIYLLEKGPWDLYFVQTHAVDHASHLWINRADPHTASSKEESAEYLGYLARVYAASDTLIGKVLEACGDDETLAVVVSDHGMRCYETQIVEEPTWERAIPAREVLKKAGLTVTYLDENGKERIDWSKSRVVPVRDCFLYVNLKGRDPQGIVEPGAEYERAVTEAVTAMRTYVEPRLGRCPFSLVLAREDARILGHYTERSGDIVYCVDDPYAYIHGQQLPANRLGLSSLRFTWIMAGPGVRKGERVERNVWLTDVCPTICHLADLPVPKQCEGAIAYQALAEMP
jgi:predicted AlkP superfamily phosphohydrolase/phosphomutase